MQKDTETTVVIFRKYRDTEEIIALFPEIPAEMSSYRCCDSFMINEGHGAADPWVVMHPCTTVSASHEESLKIRRMLEEHYGYRLRVSNELLPQYREMRRMVFEKQRRDALKAAR